MPQHPRSLISAAPLGAHMSMRCSPRTPEPSFPACNSLVASSCAPPFSRAEEIPKLSKRPVNALEKVAQLIGELSLEETKGVADLLHLLLERSEYVDEWRHSGNAKDEQRLGSPQNSNYLATVATAKAFSLLLPTIVFASLQVVVYALLSKEIPLRLLLFCVQSCAPPPVSSFCVWQLLDTF